MKLTIKVFLLTLLAFSLGYGASYKYSQISDKTYDFNKKFSDSEIVRVLNSTPKSFATSSYCQTKDDALKYGGRLCYYVYTYARPHAGAILMPVIFKMNKNIIENIYVGIAIKKDGRGGAIGGFFDAYDHTSLGLDAKVKSNIEGAMFADFRKNGPIQSWDKYYTPELYKKAEKENNFIDPRKAHYDKSFIDNVLRETKEESEWNLSKDDLLTEQPTIIMERGINWTQITTIYPAYLGDFDQNGNLEDESKNILIKDYTCKGYDDIEKIKFIPITSFKSADKTLLLGELKLNIDATDSFSKYQELMIIIMNYAFKTKYNITLSELNSLQNVDGSVTKFLENGYNGENTKNLLKYLASRNTSVK